MTVAAVLNVQLLDGLCGRAAAGEEVEDGRIMFVICLDKVFNQLYVFRIRKLYVYVSKRSAYVRA